MTLSHHVTEGGAASHDERDTMSSNEQTQNEDPQTFEVGDGVTVHGWSDSQAYTVIAVSASGRTITIQRDKATRENRDEDTFAAGGFMGHTSHGPNGQVWSYERDPEGAICKATRRRDGKWRVSHSTATVTAGRHEFYDYNF